MRPWGAEEMRAPPIRQNDEASTAGRRENSPSARLRRVLPLPLHSSD